ncbi:unnamed protein product [Heterobilharzia americana]|nr:unnamed protein product [Heterobilharzia americana]
MVSGAYRFDFSNPDETCFEVAKMLPQTGITAYCPTIITSQQDFYKRLVSAFANYQSRTNYPKMLGVHLEGPFISRNCARRHPISYIKEFRNDPARNIFSQSITLVINCITAFGPHDSLYTFILQNIQADGGKAYFAGTKCLAGDTTLLLTCVRSFWLEVTCDKIGPEPSVPKEWGGLG